MVFINILCPMSGGLDVMKLMWQGFPGHKISNSINEFEMENISDGDHQENNHLHSRI